MTIAAPRALSKGKAEDSSLKWDGWVRDCSWCPPRPSWRWVVDQTYNGISEVRGLVGTGFKILRWVNRHDPVPMLPLANGAPNPLSSGYQHLDGTIIVTDRGNGDDALYDPPRYEYSTDYPGQPFNWAQTLFEFLSPSEKYHVGTHDYRYHLEVECYRPAGGPLECI